METLKVCLLNIDFIPFRGSGLALYCERLTKELSKRCDLTVITLQSEGTRKEEYIDDVRVIRIPMVKIDRTKWLSFGYQASRMLNDLDKKAKFDLVHFVDVHFGYACSKPYIATLHQSFNQRLKSAGPLPYYSSFLNLIERSMYYNLAKILEKRSLHKAIKLISVSNATKKDFVENYDVAPSKIEVIYNGIDPDFFRPRNPEKLREKLGIKDHQKVLLYVGFTTPRKGIEYLADAMKNVTHDFKLIIVGKWEKGYREKFFRRVGENKEKIIEVGYVDDEDMPYYYSLADLFILPSLLEGFGFPLIEALSCETPVVSTTVGSIPEIIGDCGILVPPKDSMALANAINALFADDDLRRKLGKKGRTRVQRHFTEKKMGEKTLEFYKSIARGGA